jgi:hypothetical protein
MSSKRWRPEYWSLLMAWGLLLFVVFVIEYFIK